MKKDVESSSFSSIGIVATTMTTTTDPKRSRRLHIPLTPSPPFNSTKRRIRSASVGGCREAADDDIQARRYWAFLFQNLRRAVEDLYTTCESDDSVSAAKEVILVFENYVRDFKNLADWLRHKYENTPPPPPPPLRTKRPTSLTWEIRKSSSSTTPPATLAAAKRALSFDIEVDGSSIPEEKPKKLAPTTTTTTTATAETASTTTTTTTTSATSTTTQRISRLSRPSTGLAKSSLSATNTNTVAKTSSSPKLARSLSASTRASSSSSSSTPTATTATSSMITSTTTNSSSTANGPKAILKSKTSINLKTNEGSPKQHRVSLVARQTMRTTTPTSTPTPAATIGNVRPSSAKPASATSRSRVVPTRSISNLARASTKPVPPSNGTNSVPPFGSTSSISSSSSNRSWADTVKGLKHPSSTAPSTPNTANAQSAENLKKVNGTDDDGWETVRPRTRAKYAVSAAKNRFRVPTSAMSMPSLVEKKAAPQENASSENHKRKLGPAKSLSLTSMRRDRQKTPNLEKVNEKANKSSSSSSSSVESLPSTVKSNSSKGNKEKSNQKLKKELLKAAEEVNLTEDSIKQQQQQQQQQVFVVVAKDEEEEIAQKEVAIALAEKEEENLAREILETEKAELTEDTDGDTDVDKRSDSATPIPIPNVVVTKTPPLQEEQRDEKEQIPTHKLSWAEQMDLEEEHEARFSGRVIQLHEKLSSPARKREPHEAFKYHQEKQIRAQVRRTKFQEEKASKLSALNARIEEVIDKKEMLISERSEMIMEKMRKAEVKRQEHIEGIRKKAHEEEAKLKEIAFINELQAQNMRIDMLVQNQAADEKCEGRLAELAEERAKKMEQREAKEARAEERRRDMEAKRQKDMERLKERIRTREERIQEEQEQIRKDRREAAREKARDREERLNIVRNAEKDMKEELQEKIQQKQEDAAKRHKEKLENIRAKAFELSVQRSLKDDDSSVPLLQHYNPKKKCEICSVLIINEVHLQSHLRGKTHGEKVILVNGGRSLSGEEIQTCNVKSIIDASANEYDLKAIQGKERNKAMKKRSKKIKTRMAVRAAEYEKKLTKSSPGGCNNAPNRAKIGKALKDIEKLLVSQGKGSWPNNSVSALDRALNEICRTFEKNIGADQGAFYYFDGFTVLSKIFHCLADQKTSCVIPLKSICLCSKSWSSACRGNKFNMEFVLMSNSLTPIIDILYERLNLLIPDDYDFESPRVDPVARSIMILLTQVLNDVTISKDLETRVQDQVSYIISIGIVDKLSGYFNGVRDPIDSLPEVGEFLMTSLQFLSSLTHIVEVLNSNGMDPTQLFVTFRMTDLAGTVSMLYGMLLHQNRPARGENPPPKLPGHTLSVTLATAQLLHRIVRHDLNMVQDVLGSEGISLEFRHIASYLLWYCQCIADGGIVTMELLHETIVLVGYFTAGHVDNQLIVKSGHQPSILQQLCNLPFPYFSQPELKKILFPTLLACCHNNKENMVILEEEMSFQLIEDFLKSLDGKDNHLVQLVLKSS